VDDQVKIDGYRVELGEVEAALAAAPGVAGAAAAMLTGSATASLVAVVAPATIDVADVRAHVAETLPRYMTPMSIVAVDAIPLTVSGKRDRKAVCAVVMRASRAQVADPLEYLRLTAESFLGRPVGADAEGLIQLGVGSLGTARIMAEVEERFGAVLALDRVVAARTLADIAAMLVPAAETG
jgi:hypothetical protein